MQQSTLQVVSLKRHAYAPEMNRAFLSNGTSIKTPGCLTISEAQEHINEMNQPKKLYAVMDENGCFSYSSIHPMIKMHG